MPLILLLSWLQHLIFWWQCGLTHRTAFSVGIFSIPLESGDFGEREVHQRKSYPCLFEHNSHSCPLYSSCHCRLPQPASCFERGGNIAEDTVKAFSVLLWQWRAGWQISLQIFFWGIRFQSVFFRTLCSFYASLGEVREKEGSLKCYQSCQRRFLQWISNLV